MDIRVVHQSPEDGHKRSVHVSSMQCRLPGDVPSGDLPSSLSDVGRLLSLQPPMWAVKYSDLTKQRQRRAPARVRLLNFSKLLLLPSYMYRVCALRIEALRGSSERGRVFDSGYPHAAGVQGSDVIGFLFAMRD